MLGTTVCWLLLAACQQDVASIDCTTGTCVGSEGNPPVDTEPPRLYIDPPFGVGFECVTLGCSDVRTFLVENRGGGSAHIVRMRLSEESSTEIRLELYRDEADDAETLPFPSDSAPLVLTRGQSVVVKVRYTPDDADADQGVFVVDWYDGAVAYEDAVVRREELPIQTRVLGAPQATPGDSELRFGYVGVGQTREAFLEVSNTTSGDAVLALSPPTLVVEGESPFTLPGSESSSYVNPGQTIRIPVYYAPTQAAAHAAQVIFGTNDGGRPQLSFWLRGTAIETATLAIVEPAEDSLDFGDVPVGEQRAKSVLIANRGGTPLEITAYLDSDAPSGTFSTPESLGTPWPPLAPLEERRIEIVALPTEGAQASGMLRLDTNEANQPSREVELRVLGLRPLLQISPANLHFGDVVQSWTTAAQAFGLRNSGNGELTVRNIEWELGSSSQLRIVSVPTLPIKLRPEDDPVEISVLMEANSLGPVRGTVLVETDAASDPIQRVDVMGEVVSCEQGCPVENGSPSCTSGRCAVGGCDNRFHNTDSEYANGCECGEDVTPQGNRDLGSTCSSGVDVGPITDDCGSSNQWVVRQGSLHTLEDEDLYFFQALDESGGFCDFTNDTFRVRVELVNPPPGVEFCKRSYENDDGNKYCGGENQRTCGLTSWSQNGGWGGDDDLDVTVWVRRVPGFPATCSEYTIRFSANEKN